MVAEFLADEGGVSPPVRASLHAVLISVAEDDSCFESKDGETADLEMSGVTTTSDFA
jgi:hypothetical protein